jgi:hypothetical protein
MHAVRVPFGRRQDHARKDCCGNPKGEKATLWEYFGNYRLTLDMKCGGLDAEQLARRSVPPSALSLLGLIRHLAQVENH